MSSSDSTDDGSDDSSVVEDYFGNSNAEVLSTFAASPAGFIFGIILTPLLNGFENLVVTTLEYVNLVFFGDSRGSTEGMFGLADIPIITTDLLISVGTTVGWPILDQLRKLSRGVVDVADMVGPLGLLGAAVVLAVVVYVYAATIRTLIEVALDFIPGGGAFIN